MKKLSLNKIKDMAKLSFNQEQKTTSEGDLLIKNLDETKAELTELNQSLNYITDPILVNQVIFQIKAAEVRYRYWFCMAREMKLQYPQQTTQTNV